MDTHPTLPLHVAAYDELEELFRRHGRPPHHGPIFIALGEGPADPRTSPALRPTAGIAGELAYRLFYLHASGVIDGIGAFCRVPILPYLVIAATAEPVSPEIYGRIERLAHRYHLMARRLATQAFGLDVVQGQLALPSDLVIPLGQSSRLHVLPGFAGVALRPPPAEVAA